MTAFKSSAIDDNRLQNVSRQRFCINVLS